MQKKVPPPAPDRDITRPRSARWTAAVLIAALLAAGWYGYERLVRTAAVTATAPAAPEVVVAKPVVKSVVEWRQFTGRFAPTELVDIRSRVAGYLDTIHFQDGALVKKGDLLFSIDKRPYQFALEQANATIASAKARIAFAAQDVERGDRLARTGTLTSQTAEQRRRDLAVAQADLAGAEGAARRAQLDIEFCAIKSPVDGRVSRKNISVGNLVNANDTVLTTLVSLDPIYFYFDVDERSVLTQMRLAQGGKLANGADTKQARIALSDEAEASLTGVLDFKDNRIDDQSGTLRMRAIVQNGQYNLTPGLFGRISIPVSPMTRTVLVPDEAIVSDQDRRLVYQIGPESTVKPVAVVMGPKIDGYRVIRSGLDGDETIIVNGIVRARAGIKVRTKSTDLPPVAVTVQQSGSKG